VTRVHAYYAFQKDLRAEPNLQGNTIPGFGDTRSSHRQIGTLNYTRTFGGNTVNEARLGWNRINITFAPNVTDDPAGLGISSGNTGVLPQITVHGVGLNFGGPNGFPQGRIDSTYVLSDTLTWALGRHSLKLGGEFRTFHNVNFGTNGGAFTYPSLADFQAGAAAASRPPSAASTATSTRRRSASSSRTTSRCAPTSRWSWACAGTCSSPPPITTTASCTSTPTPCRSTRSGRAARATRSTTTRATSSRGWA